MLMLNLIVTFKLYFLKKNVLYFHNMNYWKSRYYGWFLKMDLEKYFKYSSSFHLNPAHSISIQNGNLVNLPLLPTLYSRI